MGRMGGDSPLTEDGQKYANALTNFFKKENVEVRSEELFCICERVKLQDLRVWCSQKIRAVQTASSLEGCAHVEYWKVRTQGDR